MSVRLSDLLPPERVRVPLTASDRLGILRELTELATHDGAPSAAERLEEVVRAVLAREALLSTGLGFGVAIPHAQTDSLDRLTLAAGIAPRPVNFDALDGQPVRLFFLLLSPVSAASLTIRVLSRIARLVRREAFRERLLGARDASEFSRMIAEADER